MGIIFDVFMIKHHGKKIKSTPSKEATIAQYLNQLLADENVLLLKTKKAHWNVEGPDFYAMHKFFEAQYEQLAKMIDEIAERIRMVGHYAVATMEEYLEISHISEVGENSTRSKDFIKDLTISHDQIITFLKEIAKEADDLNELGTHDFLVSILQEHEEMYWMLNAHLK